MVSPTLTRTVLIACAALALAGCRTTVQNPITDDWYSPKPPDLPRVQFLRSFNRSEDFKKGATLLDYFAGAEDTPQYVINKPFSVASAKGRIYVTDSFGLQVVSVFDLERKAFYVLGAKPGAGKLKKPIHVFVDEKERKFVSDLARRQVVVFGPDDTYLRAYGDGKSFLPVACVARDDEVFILDIEVDRVKVEDSEDEEVGVRRDQILVLDANTGKPLRRIGLHGKPPNGFLFASFLTLDREGNLYVSDAQNHRVVKLDRNGQVLLAFGNHGDQPGEFASLKGVAIDPHGIIYVVDAAFQAVQIFDATGAALFGMGGPDAPVAPMSLPAGIWIDTKNLDYFQDLYAPDFTPEYLIYVTNQLSFQDRVAVYAFGKKSGVEYPPNDAITTLEKANKDPLYRLDVVLSDPATPSEGKRADDSPLEGRAPDGEPETNTEP